MGTLHQKLPPGLIQDLKVKVHSSSLVFPSQETERKSMFLSNIDQVLTFDVQTVHFFPAHKDFPSHEVIAEKIRDTLGKILVPYDFLAGRSKMNAETGRLEIDCNVSGAGFVEASTEYCLDQIGDLVYPNPGFSQLVCSTFDFLKPDDRPLCVLQVTSFKCGGFALGFTTNHVTFDGLSFKHFLQNLAAVAADKSLPLTPCHDRRLLAARSPPRVEFPHPELLKLTAANPNVFEATDEDLIFKIFRLSSDDISNLKEKARKEEEFELDSSRARSFTSFNVVTAFVWRCKALSHDAAADRESRILYAVDIRRRLSPALPETYAGNAVLTGYATGKCKQLEEGPFSAIVERVAEGARRITDDYARSAIDWGEVYKGFPHGEVLVSSWWRLGFAEVEYPWGKPRYSCPVVYHRKDIILLFPEIISHQDHNNVHNIRDVVVSNNGHQQIRNDGVNVLLALPAKEMEKFDTFFHNFLFG